jgi:SpoIIAA-like
VIERIEDMPPHTIGFRLSGKLNGDEYFVIRDAAQEELDQGGKISILIDVSPDVSGFDEAILQLRSASRVTVSRGTSWERLAIMTDAEWVMFAFLILAWILPGDIVVFAPTELEKAKAWTGGGELEGARALIGNGE